MSDNAALLNALQAAYLSADQRSTRIMNAGSL